MNVVPHDTLAYGLQLPIQSHSERYVAPWELAAGPAELGDVAVACEEAGFLYVGVCDHVAIPRERSSPIGATWYDTIATLSWLAAKTARVRLLSHVYVLPYRPPLMAAKAFATLDCLSGGRSIIGLGAGYLEEEFELLGVPFRERGRRFDEGIDELIRGLADDDVDGFVLAPRPVQQPRPPIWIGGSSSAALRRVARVADGWLPEATPRREMPAKIQELDIRCRELNRQQPVDIGAMSESIFIGQPTWDLGDGFLGDNLTGSGEQIAESLREFVQMGASHVMLRFKARSCTELIDQIGKFGTEVAPLLRN